MTINELPKYMLICLSLTIVIECIIAFIIGIRKKDLVIVLLVNILTNPLVVSISSSIDFKYGIKYKNYSMIILEILVLIIEGLIYKKNLDYKKINPFLISLILNASSYLFGFILW